MCVLSTRRTTRIHSQLKPKTRRAEPILLRTLANKALPRPKGNFRIGFKPLIAVPFFLIIARRFFWPFERMDRNTKQPDSLVIITKSRDLNKQCVFLIKKMIYIKKLSADSVDRTTYFPSKGSSFFFYGTPLISFAQISALRPTGLLATQQIGGVFSDFKQEKAVR